MKKKEMSVNNKHITDLKDIGKKNSFIVPKGYFENFSSRLNERMASDKNDFHLAERSRLFSMNRLALAASFIGLLLLIFTGIKFLIRDNNQTKVSSVEIAEVTDYQIDDIDEQMLFDLFSKTISEDPQKENQDDTEILKDAMIEYLLYTDIDVRSIIQEL